MPEIINEDYDYDYDFLNFRDRLTKFARIYWRLKIRVTFLIKSIIILNMI